MSTSNSSAAAASTPSPQQSMAEKEKATQEFKAAFEPLLQALENHPKFSEQQDKKRGKVYYMWDYTHSTLRMLEDPDLALPCRTSYTFEMPS